MMLTTWSKQHKAGGCLDVQKVGSFVGRVIVQEALGNFWRGNQDASRLTSQAG